MERDYIKSGFCHCYWVLVRARNFVPFGNELLFLAVVSDQIEPRALDALELCGAFRSGKILADAESVTLKCIDRGESLANIWSFGAVNGHALWLAGGIERVGAFVGVASDRDFILTVFELEANALQDGLGHGLSSQVGLGRCPNTLNCFGVAGLIGSERGQ